jgi:hypothetical protein
MATSGRSRAIEILQSLRNDWSVSDAEMLDYIICNWMSGEQAEAVMVDFSEEYDILVPSKEDNES